MAADKTYIEIGSNIPSGGFSDKKNPSGAAALNIQVNCAPGVTTVVQGVLADIQGSESPSEADWVEVSRFIGPGIFPVKNTPSLIRVGAVGGTILRARAMAYKDPKAVPDTLPASIADIEASLNPIVQPISAAADAAGVEAARANTAMSNTALSDLGLRAQSAGPQIVDGSRWVWKATGPANGGTVVAASGGGFWWREITGPVDARMFGASENLADNAPQINAWLTFLASQANSPVVGQIAGLFGVKSPVILQNFNGVTILGNAYIYARPDFVGSQVFEVKNGASFHVFGRLEVSASYLQSVTSAIKIWSNNSGGASNMNLYNVIPTAAVTGWVFGDLAHPSALVSEITIFGGHSYGCPRYLKAIGTQTYINVTGANAISGSNGGDASWQAITQVTYTLIGANLNVTGGEAQHNADINGQLVSIQPITDPTFGNSYGSVSFVNTYVESAATLVVVQNPDGVAAPISNRCSISFTGCLGFHSQNNGPLITTPADYAGRIEVASPNIYSLVARTQPNISCAGPAHVYYNDRSWGNNFVDGLQGIQGGIVHFSHRRILEAQNANNQAFAVSTQATVKWISPQTDQDMARFSAGYVPATGVFTVPTGGLKGVQIHSTLRTNNTAAALEMYVYVNGAIALIAPATPAGSNAIVSIFGGLGNLAAGTTVEIRAAQIGQASTANGGSIERMTIWASN